MSAWPAAAALSPVTAVRPAVLAPPSSCAICKTAIAQPTAAAVPVNFDLISAVERAAEAEARVAALQQQMVEAQQQAADRDSCSALAQAQPCAVQSQREEGQGQAADCGVCCECDGAASVYCEECADDFCAEHSQQMHVRRWTPERRS